MQSSSDADRMWSMYIESPFHWLCTLSINNKNLFSGIHCRLGANSVTPNTQRHIVPKCRNPRKKRLLSLGTVSMEEASNDPLLRIYIQLRVTKYIDCQCFRQKLRLQCCWRSILWLFTQPSAMDIPDVPESLGILCR